MKKLLMALMLCGAALAQAEDEVKATGKSVDVMKLDISGVRLGMSQEEALKILKEKFPKDKKPSKGESDDSYSKLHGKPYVKNIIFNNRKDKDLEVVSVNFAPNVLENKPQELVVSAVEYYIGDDLGVGLAHAPKIKKAAVDKFGAPVVIDSDGNYYWCDLGGKKECDENKPYLATKQPTLVPFRLMLENKALTEAAKKAAKEAGKKADLEDSKNLKI